MKSILDRLRNITSNPVFVEIGLVLLISSLMAVLADKVTTNLSNMNAFNIGTIALNVSVIIIYLALLTGLSVIKCIKEKYPLLRWIATWVLLSVAAYTLLSWLWGGSFLAGWKSGQSLSFKELLSSTFTAVGGIGAVGYLVIKYREQASAEREEVRQNEGEADKQLTAAIKQLGSKSPQVRIAGVYALADVADTYGSEKYRVDYNKRVVEILCGYLRTERHIKVKNTTDSDMTAHSSGASNPKSTNNKTEILDEEFEKDFKESITTAAEKELTQNPTLNSDGPTESAVLCVLRDHLRFYPPGSSSPEDSRPGPWSRYLINLDGATIMEPLDFQYTHTSKLSCKGTVFYNEVSFTGSHFRDAANFGGCIFNSYTKFQLSTFHYDVNFGPAGDGVTTFVSDADFRGVKFSGKTTFQRTKFARVVSFASTEKGDRSIFVKVANFRGAVFENEANFHQAIFRKEADFSPDYTEYNTSLRTQDSDPIKYPTKLVRAIFTKTYFIGCADFDEAKMDELTEFQGALFNEDLKEAFDMHFPPTITLTSDRLPKGAIWTEFINDEPNLIEQ